MPNLTIYVRDDDMHLFETAKKIEAEMSLSQILSQALREYLIKRELLENNFQQIALKIGTDMTESGSGTYRNIRFVGRLVAESKSSKRDRLMYDGGDDWYLYTTPKGGWVVVREHWWKNEDIDFNINPLYFNREFWTATNYNAITELKDDTGQKLVPLNLLRSALECDDFVEDLDI